MPDAPSQIQPNGTGAGSPTAPDQIATNGAGAGSPTAPDQIATNGAGAGSPTAPSQITSNKSAGVASLETDLAGSNNDLVITAIESGAAGAGISFAIAEPEAAAATTAVAVTDEAIVVTPGSKARMIVTGDLTSAGNPTPQPVTFPEMIYVGLWNGRPEYKDAGETGFTAYWDSEGAWLLFSADGSSWESSEDVATPDLVETWYSGAATGTPIVTPAVSSAAQVKAAIEADEDAAALVTVELAAGNDGTGAVAAMAATHLSTVPAPDPITA